MNVYRLTFLSIRIISIITLITALKTVNKIIDFFFRRFEYPGLYNTIPRKIISDFGPFIIYMLITVVLWGFTKWITNKLVPNSEREIEINSVIIFQIGIGLVGIYMLTLDISGVLWTIRDYFGEQLGLVHNEGTYGFLLDMVVNLFNLAVSLFILFKAGWISRKLHSIWKSSM